MQRFATRSRKGCGLKEWELFAERLQAESVEEEEKEEEEEKKENKNCRSRMTYYYYYLKKLPLRWQLPRRYKP